MFASGSFIFLNETVKFKESVPANLSITFSFIFQVWMCITGAQRKLELNPNVYKQMTTANHDQDLIETIQMGENMHFLDPYKFDVLFLGHRQTTPDEMPQDVFACRNLVAKETKMKIDS